MRTTFGERLDAAMHGVDLNIEQTALKVGRSPSTIYRWLSLSEAPRIEDPHVIWKLADATHTAARYIIIGQGGSTQCPGLTEQESLLLEQFRHLSPRARATVAACCAGEYRNHVVRRH